VTSVALGTTVHDSATVTGIPGLVPTGSVTFTFYTASDQCTGASVGAGTVTLNASGVAHPSTSQGPLAAGSYSFRASYRGDRNYNASTSPCEPLTVTKANSSTATTIHNATHSAVTSVALGTTVHDSATVSGTSFGTPTGSVTFTFFTASDQCTGASVGAGTVTLVSGVAHPSTSQGPLAAGAYSFRASYSGDGNYNASTSPCEPLTVTKANSSTATDIHNATHSVVTNVPAGTTVHDKATVTGISGFVPTGSVTFTFYTASNQCTGASVGAGTVTLDASGVAHPSTSQGPRAAGSYSFKAVYGGDSNYNGSTGPCEPLTVTKLSPGISTTPNPSSGKLGVRLNDSSTLSGGYNPTGSITFKLYPPGNTACTGTPAYQQVVTVNGNGTYSTTPGFVSNAVGTWRWTASYSGDANNTPAVSGCNAELVQIEFHPGTIGFWKNWRNQYTTSQFQQLVNYLKENNNKIYDKNNSWPGTPTPSNCDTLGTSCDDLTIAKVDAIMNVGSGTPRDQMILAQFTGLKLNLAITQLDGTGGLVQKNDDICLAGIVDVSSISGATAFFGTSTPTIQQVVNAVENRWTGTLTTNGNNWSFNFSNNTQRDMIIQVLTGINEGTLVTSSGCS
jgi:hypothetical protein